ncbi:hypothetical protein [Clostridium sp.]
MKYLLSRNIYNLFYYNIKSTNSINNLASANSAAAKDIPIP